jgi:hypothetical protein
MERKKRVRNEFSRPAPQFYARGSSHPKSIFNLPPKKIIKAQVSYQAKVLGELSFQQGDYFYVKNF